ncbi:glycosyltransferase [Stappia sp. GBMRC 2046]|uniref:Glycosyltransferase n=1 Tax=Stappia sediminis TaxID=2692190 RepID=A0A7X3LT76_9HYPH|nr:glycosyltransferase family 4 protein [Stappia sediminis]MXN64638.1 glycosyltransferase [Stappia sediminis]
MRVVEVCPYDMTRHGGVQNHIRDLARWLEAQGHETRIVAPPAMSGAPAPGVDHVGRSRRIGISGTVTEISYLPAAERAALAGDLAAWGADVLHLHTPWTPLIPWQVFRACRLPTVVTFHATLPENSTKGLSGWLYRSAARYFQKRAGASVVPSPSPMSILQVGPGVPAPRILAPTIDLEPWRNAAQPERPFDPGAPHVVFLGRLEHRKGVDVLLNAWPQVFERLPGARLTIAGDGAQYPLVDEAMKQPWGKGIAYRTAPDFDDARQLVARADIFAAPAPYGESFGIVLIEAMSAGAVPVAAANSGYRTVLDGPGESLLVQPGDSDALARKIVELAGDPARLLEMRNWGGERARQFDVREVGPAYLQLFEEVAGS